MTTGSGKRAGQGRIRAGIGGWTFEPWRGVFYPPGLKHKDELAHASRHVTAIEVNGTFYRNQTPATFRSWAEQVPDDFVFALKAPRFAVNRKDLGGAGESIARFVDSGIVELGDRLGPILWQFADTKVFNPDEIEAFCALLPREVQGRALRHVLEPRHASFAVPAMPMLLRRLDVSLVIADTRKYAAFSDVTADPVYLRLQDAQENVASGYDTQALHRFAGRARTWAAGGVPDDLDLLAPAPQRTPRDVFVFFINGAKVRAPAAAQAFLNSL
ncbi:DUF72 domain-containing protein [Zavarzinia sp. CC-PAN008]|uniref:DUF72 domain-containing protein n=1 Tax=Zavarzinia sp. CC-PAN008 TaxID=3243332 RepID=UPI003F746221